MYASVSGGNMAVCQFHHYFRELNCRMLSNLRICHRQMTDVCMMHTEGHSRAWYSPVCSVFCVIHFIFQIRKHRRVDSYSGRQHSRFLSIFRFCVSLYFTQHTAPYVDVWYCSVTQTWCQDFIHFEKCTLWHLGWSECLFYCYIFWILSIDIDDTQLKI